MARIYSNWKITFDPYGAAPLVLLNFGDDIEGEIRFPLRKSMEIVEITEAEAPFLRLKGNTHCEFAFEVYEVGATDAAARQAVLDALLETETLGKKPLKIEVNGLTDRYWLFSSSVVQEVEPTRFLETAKPRLSKRYGVTGAGLRYNIQIDGGETFAATDYKFGQITNTFAAA